MRRIVKFGGTSLETGERIRKMGLKIKQLKERGDQVIIVVSAMGKKTDELLSLVNKVSAGKSLDETRNEVLALGEIMSAKLMNATLRALGIESRAVVPESREWPIYGRVIETKSLSQEKTNQEGYATIDLVKTSENCHSLIEPLLSSGIIPVVCGFLAKDKNERIITLGRGGSDITAFLLGRCLSADEVIIVTDVSGILKGDPKLVKPEGHIDKITIKELGLLSRGGAQVIHPSSLQYKLSNQKARIIHFQSKGFESGGTEVVGYIQPEVFKTEEPLAFITIVGENFLATPGLLNKITIRLSEASCPIYGVSLSQNYIGVYVPESSIDKTYQIIFEITHIEKRFKAVSVRKGIGHLRVSNSAFIEEPGVIGRIGDLLASEGINIIEMVTIQSDITLFLEGEDLEQAYLTLKAVTI